MAIYALICFAIAAVLGIILAAMYQKGQLSLGTAVIHGLFAAIGLVLLIIAVAQADVSTLGKTALVLFIIAALGGAVLIYNHLTKHALPKPVIAIHAVVAVVAFLLLLFGIVRG
ncbi:MAG: hypothetical protein LLF76_11690 [Planctomycetaceae bacterium]|nr:hypothetical protein [Planctomycetaceae bacterium]